MANRNETHPAETDLGDQVATLKSDLHAVKSDLASISQSLLRQGKASAYAAKDDVERRLHEGVEHGRKYVEERPLTAALAAFGIGMMAGFFVSRR